MNNNQFKVFVRSITYNHSKFIKEAMDGFCMQQTDFPYICCIIDDASAMATKNGEYKVMYSNERILELTNNSKRFLLSIIDKIKDKRESQRKI